LFYRVAVRRAVLRDSGFVQHGAQPERGCNAVLFFSFPCRALDDVEAVMHKLNDRPRKTLNFKTPYEVFFPEKERDVA